MPLDDKGHLVRHVQKPLPEHQQTLHVHEQSGTTPLTLKYTTYICRVMNALQCQQCMSWYQDMHRRVTR